MSRTMKRLRRSAFAALVCAVMVTATTTAIQASTPAKTTVDKAGILRIGANLAIGSGIQTDVNGVGGPNPTWFGVLGATVLGAPLRLGKTPGTYEPWLAESYKIIDPQHFELVMRKGLTFQDGEPYTAQKLADTLMAKKAIVLKGNLPATANALDRTTLPIITDITVSSPTKLTINLSQPKAALLLEILSNANGSVVSSKSTPDHPIGAGPFKFVSLDRNTKMVLTRWDGFFDAAKYKVAGVEVINVGAGDPALNALQAGQIDMGIIDPLVGPSLAQRGNYKVVSSPLQAYYWVGICKSEKPFDDPQVRQALSMAVDRNELNQLVLNGEGKTQVGLWPKGDPRAVASIEKTAQQKPDIAKAKALLAKAGASNLSLTLLTTPAAIGQQKLAELLQAQWAKIGVTVKVVGVIDLSVAYFGASRQGDLGVRTWFEGGAQKVAIQFTVPSFANVCSYTDPQLTELANTLSGLDPTSPAAITAWHKVQQIVYDQALNIATVTQVADLGVNADRVRGLKPGCTSTAAGLSPCPNLEGVYIVKS